MVELQAKLNAAIDALAERDDKEARQDARIADLEREVSDTTLCNNLQAQLIRELSKELKKAERKLAEQQARIDELMLEYCPDEMTQEQMDNWAVNQGVVK